jgi:hypothetical protein
MEQRAISILYRDLPHPPSTHVGQEFQFRSADGSGNSLSNPNLGKSFTPYSRSCSTTRSISDDQLPDPGLIFDTLLRRGHNDASSSIYPNALWLTMNPSVRPSPQWTKWLVLQLRGKFCPCLRGIFRLKSDIRCPFPRQALFIVSSERVERIGILIKHLPTLT